MVKLFKENKYIMTKLEKMQNEGSKMNMLEMIYDEYMKYKHLEKPNGGQLLREAKHLGEAIEKAIEKAKTKK